MSDINDSVKGKGGIHAPINSTLKLFTHAFVDTASIFHGVYALWDGNVIVYYGKAEGIDGIRGRLQDHKRGSEGPCTQNATAFQEEVNFASQARESQLLREYMAQFGRLPRCNALMP